MNDQGVGAEQRSARKTMEHIDNKLPARRNPRLAKCDYTTPGAYFITICAKDYLNRFGRIRNGKSELNNIGVAVAENWQRLPRLHPGLRLDLSVLMPNHLHAILWLSDSEPGSGAAPSLIRIIQRFKADSTKQVNQLCKSPARKLWQRSFFDHVVRNDEDLSRIREYILTNPAQWQLRQRGQGNTSIEQLGKWLANVYGELESGPSVARPLRIGRDMSKAQEMNGPSVARPLRMGRDMPKAQEMNGPSVARPLRKLDDRIEGDRG